MKALMIKDFKLLKNQRMFFGTIGLLGIVFILVLGSPTFSIWYMTIALSSFTMSTISCDSYNNGEAYLFAMPIDRKEYVLEKYVYNFILTGMAVVFTGVLSLIVLSIQQREISVGYIAVSALTAFFAANMVNSLNIPLDLKFKSDKTRITSMVVWGAVVVLGLVFSFVCERLGVNMYRLIDRLFTEYLSTVAAVIAAMMVAALVISYLCSVRIMEKKEF